MDGGLFSGWGPHEPRVRVPHDQSHEAPNPLAELHGRARFNHPIRVLLYLIGKLAMLLQPEPGSGKMDMSRAQSSGQVRTLNFRGCLEFFCLVPSGQLILQASWLFGLAVAKFE